MATHTFVFEEEAKHEIRIVKGDRDVVLEPGILVIRFDAALADLPEDMRKDHASASEAAAQVVMAWLANTYQIILDISQWYVVQEQAQVLLHDLKKSSLPSPASSPSTESTPNEPE